MRYKSGREQDCYSHIAPSCKCGKSRCYICNGKRKIAESGKHRELLENKADYEKLWEAQQRLENYGKDGAVQ